MGRISSAIATTYLLTQNNAKPADLPPHQINCIKIVFDFLELDSIKSDEIVTIVNENAHTVIGLVLNRYKAIISKRTILTDEERIFLK